MKRVVIDQLNRKIEINNNLNNIISLVPSLTELLFFLKMDEQVKGITNFCVHPSDKLSDKVIVGSPLHVDYEKIEQINPDIIIAGKSENNKNNIEKIAEKYPVWVSDVRSIEDACKMIEKIGMICNQSDLSYNITKNISVGFDSLADKTKIKVCYLVWEKPFMVAGNNNYINDILKKTGLINVFEHKEGYAKVTAKEMQECQADFVLLPSEPYKFDNSHISTYKNLINKATVLLVDGQLFSWYGNRMLLAINYLKNMKKLMLSIVQ